MDPEKIIPDLDRDSPGSEINLKQNFSEKQIKFDNFSTKCSILKYKSLKKSLKSLYLS
jgi:hypothetical protein